MQKSNKSKVRPFLTSDKELIKQFFLLYISNLYQTEEESNNKTNRTQKNNNKSANANKSKQNNKNTTFELKYNNYIQLISEIYETTQDSLFRKLYDTTITYRGLVDEINDTVKDFYYVNTHGSFIRDMKPKLIPEKTVLIFLTPVNRYGIACNLSELSSIKDNLKDNRLFIQKNLPCLDKFSNNTNNKVNTRYVNNYHKMFKNAIILYSGQYYYDLELSFTKADNVTNMNINYFTGDSVSQDLIKIENYDDILSNIVDRNFIEDKYNNHSFHNSNNGIRYIIINCCRNIDVNTGLNEAFGKNIYIYENFMFYYNLIMANCNSITINPFFPDIQFASYAGYFSQNISEEIWERYRFALAGNFYKYIYKPEIIENIKNLFLPLLPEIDIAKLSYSISLLVLEYNDNQIKINTDDMFDFLNSNYKDKYPFLEYVNCMDINFLELKKIINALNDTLSEIILKKKLINRVRLIYLRDKIQIMLTNLEKFVAIPAKFKLIKEKFTLYIDAINKCLATNQKTEINLKTDCNELYQLIYDDMFTFELQEICNILVPGMKKKYLEILSKLKILLDNFLTDQINTLSFKLTNIKKRGNSKLGNKGRKTLMKTYFKKTNKNTKLSPAIQRLIESESIKVISQLNLQSLENESTA
jgi:hypothetical protein